MVSHSRIAITCFLLLPGFLLTWLGLAFIQPSDRTHATSRALRIHSPNERADETDHQSHDTGMFRFHIRSCVQMHVCVYIYG